MLEMPTQRRALEWPSLHRDGYLKLASELESYFKVQGMPSHRVQQQGNLRYITGWRMSLTFGGADNGNLTKDIRTRLNDYLTT